MGPTKLKPYPIQDEILTAPDDDSAEIQYIVKSSSEKPI